MEKIVAANLKMNLNYNEIDDYVKSINTFGDTKNLIVCPTSIYIPYFINNIYAVGVQDIDIYDEGSYTGSLSPKQVSSLKVEYAIVGHSERRKYYHENDDLVNLKIQAALRNNLTVILCIGETKEEKNLGKTKDKIKTQIINDLRNINDIDNIIIAYEPIWAIGTSIIPTLDDIRDITLYIKAIVKELLNKEVRVLYGGSVNDKNIESIISVEQLTGVLIGSASLDPQKLKKIKEVVLK